MFSIQKGFRSQRSNPFGQIVNFDSSLRFWFQFDENLLNILLINIPYAIEVEND